MQDPAGTVLPMIDPRDNNNVSNTRLAKAINDNKYDIISPTPTQLHGPPFTWYKTNREDTPKSTVDYVFGTRYTQKMTNECQILQDSRTALNTDHEAILTSLKIHTSTTNQTHTHMSTRMYQVDALADEEVRIKLTQTAEQLAPDLNTEINRLIHSEPKNANTADSIFSKYIEYCARAAETLRIDRKRRLNTHQLGKRRAPSTDTHKSAIRKLRTTLLTTRNRAEQTARNTQQQITHLEKDYIQQLTQKRRDEISQEIDDILQYTTQNTKTSVWKYVQNRRTAQNRHQQASLPTLMYDTKGRLLTTQAASAKVWHDSRRAISTAHATPTTIMKN
jgi:hypothetical protein